MRALVLVAVVACAAEPPVAAWQWQLPAGFPVPRVPADNPMTAEKVELGRYLFFDARLSGPGTQACASCHDPARAFTDGRDVPIGATGERGIHNAMSLVNVAYNSSSTWAHDVRRLEDQARLPMFGAAPVEMAVVESEALARLADEPIYSELFARAGEPMTTDGITRALASFERTIISGDSPFDRFVAGEATALDASAQRGLALFESHGCAHCHGGFNLASAYDHAGMASGQIQMFNTGLYNVDGKGAYPAGDRGLIEVTGEPGDMGRFRAPTLRNIALTAPYFHDGSAQTLDSVLDHYVRGGVASPLKSPLVTGFALSETERTDLLAFLAALTDPSIESRFASPW